MKTITLLMISLLLFSSAASSAQKAAAKPAVPAAPAPDPAAAANIENDKALDRFAQVTGIAKSQISRLGGKPDDILMAYVIGTFTGNNTENILKAAGVDFPKYNKEHGIDAAKQLLIDAKFAALKSQIWKAAASAKSDYAGIDKNLAIERMINKTGMSKGDLEYYGFNAGVDAAEILLAAELSQRTGNSFSGIMYVLKNGGWEEVWAKYCPDPQTRAAITAKQAADSAYCLPPKSGGAAKVKVAVTPDLEKAAGIIASETGSYKGKVLGYLTDGETVPDVVQAMVVAAGTGNDSYNILKLKNEKGWETVYSTYVLNKAAEIDAKAAAINAKIAAK